MDKKTTVTSSTLKYDGFLDEISRQLSFNQINPINAAEEKYKFLNSKHYSPQFKYEIQNEDFLAMANALRVPLEGNNALVNILNQKRLEYLKKIRMFSKIGEVGFSDYACEVYGVPDDYLIEKALKLVKLEPEVQDAKITTTEVKKYFQKALERYGFDWTIIEKPMVAGAAVSPSKKTLFIKEGSRFSLAFIKRLIVHEIGTHVVRAENGYRQPYTIFRRGLPGYMGTEEGLAVVNEEMSGVLNKGTLKIYAGRVLAINYALRNSFRGVFYKLRENFSPNMAWRLTLRAKRGMSDTSKAGAYTKDYLYLDGYFRVKKYIEEGNDISKLYAGKIGIEHVELLEDLQELSRENHYPKDILSEVAVCQN